MSTPPNIFLYPPPPQFQILKNNHDIRTYDNLSYSVKTSEGIGSELCTVELYCNVNHNDMLTEI